ncbi:C-C motif chemokine 5-like [Anolis carolinensis]|uniref:C-C motif chemokine 5-like n=1 Tax=Anolis carolinensis TaxID=28377 RepID=UPI002F2B7F31
MKLSSVFTTVLLLLMASSPWTSAAPYGANTSPCCRETLSAPFSRPVSVTGYFRTGGHCALPAVVLVLKKGALVCADPQAQWVKKVIADLDQ